MTTQISTTNIQPAALSFIQGPVVSSIQITNSSYNVLDDTAVDTAGGYIRINGVNFVAGMNVIIGNVTATSVSVVSSTVLNVQVPAQNAGTYIVYVTAPDGGVSIVVNGLTYSGTPVWVTSSTLSDGLVGSPLSIQLDATGATSYALAAGSNLPSGLTLTSGGLLSGTVTGLSSNTLYNFTVNAIDAELQDSPRAFSITIIVGDAEWKYVDTLLSASTPTSTFISDASTNQFLVTPIGDTRPNNFNPYTSGYYSNYFDGTGDYLTVPDNAAFEMPGDFTVEAWFYPTSTSGNYQAIVSKSASGIYAPYIFYYRGNLGTVEFSSSTDGASYNLANYTSLGSVRLNTWNHVAASRSGSSVRLFLNGTLITTITNSNALTDNSYAVGIGGRSDGTELFTGYISNVRIVKGTGLYTSSFTPSTTPLTAVSGTSLLTCLNNRITDSSTNNFTITRNGDVRVDGFDPFVPSDSFAGLGSTFFDGTGDYLTVAAGAAQDLGTSDFTWECFWYPSTISSRQALFCASTDYWFGIEYQADGKGLGLWASGNGSTWNLINADAGGNGITNTNPVLGIWNHIAVARTGGAWAMWLNGTRILNLSGITGSVVSRSAVNKNIGLWGNSQFPVTGYISNMRLVIGSLVYNPSSATVAVPVSPLTAVTNTQLLTLQNNQPINNNKFLDQSTNNALITAIGNVHQGSFNPYTGAWSNYFDGTGDMLTVTDNTGFDLSSGDFTVECWVMRTGDSGQYVEWVCGKREAGGGYRWSWNTGIDGSNKFIFSNGSTSVASVTSIAFNIWYHTAVVRSGSTITMYINGTAEATGTMTVNNYASDLTIGNYPIDNPTYTGYISNLRIVKGTAVYTSNFTVPTSPLTPITNTQLLTCQSNRFIDNGPRGLSVTRSGDVIVNKSSPFGPLTNYTPTSYSGYFDGTGDYLSIPTTTALSFGTGDFTVEAWVYKTTAGVSSIIDARASLSASPWSVFIDASNFPYVYDGTTYTSSVAVSLNTWTHIAVSRSSGTLRIFVNGVQGFSSSVTTNYDRTAGAIIGARVDGTASYFTGYISNLRVVKGTAVYTSAFTPPTTPLSAITNTSLLTCQSPTFVDNSTNNFTITVNGNSQPTIQNPFGYTNPSTVSYTPATYSGSAYFDGTGDYLITPDSPITEPGSSNLTWEMWINTTSSTQYATLYSRTPSSFASGMWTLLMNNASATAGDLALYVADFGGSPLLATTGVNIRDNAWHHVAVVRNGSAWTLYVDGTSRATGTWAGTIANIAGGPYVGADQFYGRNYTGYIADLRITNGIARYNSNFVPPIAPLTAQQNTTLLLNMTGAGIYDSSMTANYQSIADTRITTSLEKYGTGSIYFDGTGDYLTTISNPSLAPRTSDFTWEAWVYFPSGSSYRQVFSNRTGPTNSANNGSLAINPSNGLTWYTDGFIVNYTTSIGTNQWVHVAVCRSGTTLRVFANGTSVGSATNSQNLTGSVLSIGANNDGSEAFNGWMDDVRITNGIARYTSNFTPTTTPFLTK